MRPDQANHQSDEASLEVWCCMYRNSASDFEVLCASGARTAANRGIARQQALKAKRHRRSLVIQRGGGAGVAAGLRSEQWGMRRLYRYMGKEAIVSASRVSSNDRAHGWGRWRVSLSSWQRHSATMSPRLGEMLRVTHRHRDMPRCRSVASASAYAGSAASKTAALSERP